MQHDRNWFKLCWVWDESKFPRLSISLASSVWVYCKRGWISWFRLGRVIFWLRYGWFQSKDKNAYLTKARPNNTSCSIVNFFWSFIIFDLYLSCCLCFISYNRSLTFLNTFECLLQWRHADPILIVLTRPDVPLLGVVMRTRLLAADIRLISKWESDEPYKFNQTALNLPIQPSPAPRWEIRTWSPPIMCIMVSLTIRHG